MDANSRFGRSPLRPAKQTANLQRRDQAMARHASSTPAHAHDVTGPHPREQSGVLNEGNCATGRSPGDPARKPIAANRAGDEAPDCREGTCAAMGAGANADRFALGSAWGNTHTAVASLKALPEKDLSQIMPPVGPPYPCGHNVTFGSDIFCQAETGCRMDQREDGSRCFPSGGGRTHRELRVRCERRNFFSEKRLRREVPTGGGPHSSMLGTSH